MSLLTLESCNKIIIRRDSKDSCYSEEMTEDLSATNIDDCCRLSPLATLSPVSRKSSGSDSAVSMEYEGELSGVSYLQNYVKGLRVFAKDVVVSFRLKLVLSLFAFSF